MRWPVIFLVAEISIGKVAVKQAMSLRMPMAF